MRDQSKQDQGCLDLYTERLVVLELLRRKRGIRRAQLATNLRPIEPDLVKDAVASLAQAGVVVVKRTRVHQSAVLQRLDELTMICV